jgi:hypothetical protein
VGSVEEFLRGGIRGNVEVSRAEQAAECLAHAGIVINDGNRPVQPLTP